MPVIAFNPRAAAFADRRTMRVVKSDQPLTLLVVQGKAVAEAVRAAPGWAAQP